MNSLFSYISFVPYPIQFLILNIYVFYFWDLLFICVCVCMWFSTLLVTWRVMCYTKWVTSFCSIFSSLCWITSFVCLCGSPIKWPDNSTLCFHICEWWSCLQYLVLPHQWLWESGRKCLGLRCPHFWAVGISSGDSAWPCLLKSPWSQVLRVLPSGHRWGLGVWDSHVISAASNTLSPLGHLYSFKGQCHLPAPSHHPSCQFIALLELTSIYLLAAWVLSL